jgi:hypothetical protein
MSCIPRMATVIVMLAFAATVITALVVDAFILDPWIANTDMFAPVKKTGWLGAPNRKDRSLPMQRHEDLQDGVQHVVRYERQEDA